MEDDTTAAEDSTTTSSSSSGRDPTRLDPIRIEDGDLLIGRADDEDVGELTDLYEYFTEEEMNELRSQIIMQQIRMKLRMTSPLNHTLIEAAKRRLPEPLEKELTHELEMMQSDQWHPPADYFYGKNMQTVIFAKKCKYHDLFYHSIIKGIILCRKGVYVNHPFLKYQGLTF